ncbi:MAG: site-specific integrase [Holophagaceae bacterium]|nr:site-specific integrase [Holophagaceae bacterium]
MTRAKPAKASRKAAISFITSDDRAKIPIRKAPYWMPLGEGQSLGLQKRETGTVWLARLTTPRRQEVIGVPEEERIRSKCPTLTCAQAMIVAEAWCQSTLNPPLPATPLVRAAGSTTVPEDPTIGDALDQALHVLESRQIEAVGTSRSRINKIKREIGHIKLKKLVMQDLTDWLANMVITPPARRSKKGAAPNYAADWDPNNPVNKRRRQSTANRCLSDLKAALNRAYRNRWVDSDQAWSTIEPFPDATGVREEVLDAKQQSDFLNACTPEFRPLAFAALLTGIRYGPMTRWKVKDFRPLDHCLRVGWDKRHRRDRLAPLTDEAMAVFYYITEDRDPEDFIFLKANGKPWGRNHQLRPMGEGTKSIDIDISFYNLRHTAITNWMIAGVEAEVVAIAVGTTPKMINEHYTNPRIGVLADKLNKKVTRISSSNAEIEFVSRKFEKLRLERLECSKELDFSFASLHPRNYIGKLYGGLVDAPPPKVKPTREELQALVWEIPVSHIAEKYEVSGVTIKKWCEKQGIEVPARGYWTRRRCEERQAAKLAAKGLPPRPPKPSKEVLEDLIWKMPATDVAKMFDTTGPTVLKWAVRMGIKCPGRGYWSKRGGEAYQKRKKALCLAARRKAAQSMPDVTALSA